MRLWRRRKRVHLDIAFTMPDGSIHYERDVPYRVRENGDIVIFFVIGKPRVP